MEQEDNLFTKDEDSLYPFEHENSTADIILFSALQNVGESYELIRKNNKFLNQFQVSEHKLNYEANFKEYFNEDSLQELLKPLGNKNYDENDKTFKEIYSKISTELQAAKEELSRQNIIIGKLQLESLASVERVKKLMLDKSSIKKKAKLQQLRNQVMNFNSPFFERSLSEDKTELEDDDLQVAIKLSEEEDPEFQAALKASLSYQ